MSKLVYMSNEVLKAVLRLFAILIRQDSNISQAELDYVHDYLSSKVETTATKQHYNDFLEELTLKRDTRVGEAAVAPMDSMDIVRICYKINGTLNQPQKVITIVECLELLKQSSFKEQKEDILKTCSDIFKIPEMEFEELKMLVDDDWSSTSDNFRVFDPNSDPSQQGSDNDSRLVFLLIKSVNLLLFKVFKRGLYKYNNTSLLPYKVKVLAPGSVLRTKGNKNFFYSDVYSLFAEKKSVSDIYFIANNIKFNFNRNTVGLHPMNISSNGAQLIAIMGGSGSGKTTLLKVLAGLEQPSEGNVYLNSIDINEDKTHRMIGYVSQDDLLIEDLTVFQNLYFNAKLFFKNLDEEALTEKVDLTLAQLGLIEARDLKVGSVLKKVLSGGQRKRLNIGLELMRNPPVFFLDEPLSGLSSKDSMNVLALLNELKFRGHLLYVVVHQPSSDIYKLFDEVILIDKGGYCIYSGNPIKAISYFKDAGDKLNQDLTHCSVCGTVRPEDIFNIVEEKIYNEYGVEIDERKVKPREWYERFKQYNLYRDSGEKEFVTSEKFTEQEGIPSKFSQFKTYFKRDILSKISNLPYLVLTILEPVFLATILALLVRQTGNKTGGEYLYYYNENIPAYIFIAIIVVMFIGLTMSAEEILRDQKVRARESFLRLSKLSYLSSKFVLQALIAAVQVFLFCIIGNNILEIENGNLAFYIMLFTIAVNANLLGLLISSTFNSAVVIYIMIPLIIIPQLVLGGAMFHYEKLNLNKSSVGFAPFVSAFIPARWAYEGLAVHLFKYNQYEEVVYDYERDLSQAAYKNGPYISKLYSLLEESTIVDSSDKYSTSTMANVHLLRRSLQKEIKSIGGTLTNLTIDGPISKKNALNIKSRLAMLSDHYISQYNRSLRIKDAAVKKYNATHPVKLNELKMLYHNSKLESLVKKEFSDYTISVWNGQLLRLYEPIFDENSITEGLLYPRYTFFSPNRKLLTLQLDTFWYNIIILWLSSFVLFILLYINLPRKVLKVINRLRQ